MGKRWMILLCVFSMLTFINSLVYNVFLFSNDQKKTEINSSSVLASNNIYKKTNIIYYRNNNIVLSELFPSDAISHTFSITNNNSEDLNYMIEWNDISSTWNINNLDSSQVHPEEFVYSLNCSDGTIIQNHQMPINNDNNVIVDNLTLKTNTTNTCELKIEFIKIEEDQSYNFNKYFEGTYRVIVKK